MNIKPSYLYLLFLSLVSHQLIGQEATVAHKDSLDAVVANYYKLNLKVFQVNSEVNDIDNIFALFSADFTYVHPKYGGTYTRNDLYDGYVRNQKNGSYDGSVIEIRILDQITGLNAVVVEKQFIKKKEGTISKGNAQMTLFEFKDGKISRIFEYW
jgi:hypothetical protein